MNSNTLSVGVVSVVKLTSKVLSAFFDTTANALGAAVTPEEVIVAVDVFIQPLGVGIQAGTEIGVVSKML